MHALFFSEDAVSLENELHHAFADRRVNVVNQRREFFFATPEQVREVLAEKVGSLLEYTNDPESTQFLLSKASWPAEVSA
ncbi:MAG: GIY-YIG nuclease family protein [Acidimicrobiales bacterium]